MRGMSPWRVFLGPDGTADAKANAASAAKGRQRGQRRIRFCEVAHRPALRGWEGFVGSGRLHAERVERRLLGLRCRDSRRRDWTTDRAQQAPAVNWLQRREEFLELGVGCVQEIDCVCVPFVNEARGAFRQGASAAEVLRGALSARDEARPLIALRREQRGVQPTEELGVRHFHLGREPFEFCGRAVVQVGQADNACLAEHGDVRLQPFVLCDHHSEPRVLHPRAMAPSCRTHRSTGSRYDIHSRAP